MHLESRGPIRAIPGHSRGWISAPIGLKVGRGPVRAWQSGRGQMTATGPVGTDGTGTAGAAGGDPAPVVSVLIVNYNSAALARRAADSARVATGLPVEVILVDNASPEGLGDLTDLPGVTLLRLSRNIGFGRATNLAACRARGTYLLLLNPDTLVLAGAIDRLVDFARARPGAGIWGGRTLHADGSLNPSSASRRMTLWSVFSRASGLSALAPRSRLLNPEAYPGWNRDSERAVDVVTGCFLLVRRDLWRRLGGFDPSFFLYGEEVDLCLRARALGLAAPRVTPDAVIHHYERGSQPGAETGAEGPIVQVLAARIRNIRLHFPEGQQRLAVALTRTGVLLRLGAAPLAGRPAVMLWRAVWARRAEWWHGFAHVAHDGCSSDESAVIVTQSSSGEVPATRCGAAGEGAGGYVEDTA
jgi:GT2 family glycosyltransferase